MKELYRQSRVQQSPFTKDINGRDGQKFLSYIKDNKDTLDIPNKDLFLLLKSIEDFACSRELKEDEITALKEAGNNFFLKFDERIRQIEKTHLLRYHLHDFVINHRGWGLFSEQGMLFSKLIYLKILISLFRS